MTEQHPEAVPLRTRTIYCMGAEGDGAQITVDHVYAPNGAFPCDECGGPGHDPGSVGIFITGSDGQEVSALLEPGEALLLANRLQRAASLVLESDEDVPDVEREAARFSTPPEDGQEPGI